MTSLAQSDSDFFAVQRRHMSDEDRAWTAPTTTARCTRCGGPQVWDGSDGVRDLFRCDDWQCS